MSTYLHPHSYRVGEAIFYVYPRSYRPRDLGAMPGRIMRVGKRITIATPAGRKVVLEEAVR